MPVEFLCPGCRATLSVARRKIGTETVCPRCSAELMVPDEFSARAEVVMARLERSARKERRDHQRPDLALRREAPAEAAESHESWPAREASTDDAGGWQSADDGVDDAPPVVISEPPPVALWRTDLEIPRSTAAGSEYSARVRRRRRDWIAQAGLFVAIGAIAFVVGFALGRSQTFEPELEALPEEPVLLEGRVTFTDAMGSARGDSGAFVIALPLTPPEAKLRPLSLRSDDAKLADADAEQFARAGGATARADENGTFTLVAPKPGEYRLLWISRQSNRPEGEMPREQDLATLGEYFVTPIELIGLKKYALVTRKLNANVKRLEQRFR